MVVVLHLLESFHGDTPIDKHTVQLCMRKSQDMQTGYYIIQEMQIGALYKLGLIFFRNKK